MSGLNVEIYGPPGSGKSVFLAVLYKHLDRSQVKDLEASDWILKQYGLINAQQFPTASLPVTTGTDGEFVSFKRTVTNNSDATIRLVSHAGENLLDKGNLRSNEFLQRFELDPSRLFVAAMNPFVCDQSLAWKALRNLIATLQTRIGVPFSQALYMSTGALFHVEKKLIESTYPSVPAIVQKIGDGLSLTYDPTAPQVQARFRWSGGDARDVAELQELLLRMTSTIVGVTAPYRDAIREALRRLPNSVVVLTHIDLCDLISSVGPEDFNRVFEDIFKRRPDRLAYQQILGEMFRIRVDQSGIKPWDTMGESVLLFQEYVQALAQKELERLQEASTDANIAAVWSPVRESLYVFLRGFAVFVPLLIFATASIPQWLWIFSAFLLTILVIVFIRRHELGTGLIRYFEGPADRVTFLGTGLNKLPFQPSSLTLHQSFLLGRVLGVGTVTCDSPVQREWTVLDPDSWKKLLSRGLKIKNHWVLDVWLILSAVLFIVRLVVSSS